MKLIYLIATLVLSQATHALGAKEYSCLGSERYASEDLGVKFKVVYSEWDSSAGYTYEAAELASHFFGWLEIDLKQLRSPGSISSCPNAFFKELESNGDQHILYFEINDGDCDGVPAYVLKGYCELQ